MRRLVAFLVILPALSTLPTPSAASSRQWTRNALGIKVNLSNIRRNSTEFIEFDLSVAASGAASAGNVRANLGRTRIFINGAETTCFVDLIVTKSRVLKRVHVVAGRAIKKMTVAQEVRWENQCHFLFSGVSPASLPIRKKIGPVEATLRKVYQNVVVKSDRWSFQCPQRVYAVELEAKPAWISSPKYGFEASRSHAAFHMEMPREPHSDEAAKLIDGLGRRHTMEAAAYDRIAVDTEVEEFSRSIDHYNALEKVVDTVNPKFAGKMVDRRGRFAAGRTPNRDIYLYAFEPIYPAPRKFSFDLTVPTLRSRATVTFKDVPIRP